MPMLRAASPALVAAVLAASALAAQVPVEQAARDLSSPDRDARLRAARLLKESAHVEAAVPLAPLVNDPDDGVQLEAIAAELNIFLAEKIVSRRRIGLVVEVRTKIAAEAAFTAGPSTLGTAPVPVEVLTALRAALRDDNPQVAVEAAYAYGVLSTDLAGSLRRELQRASAPDLAALLGGPDAPLRLAAIRVIGRLFGRRPQEGPVDEVAGDAAIGALNDSDRAVRAAAMEALGAMRYERAVQALTDLFKYYGRGELGQRALDALARIGHSASGPLFTAQLGGRGTALKVIAIEGLARTGDSAHESSIQAALAGQRHEALGLAGSFASVLLSNGSLDEVASALGRPKLHDQALGYLAELAPGRTEALARHAQDPDPRRRAEVVEVLAWSGDWAALALVEPLVRDTDPDVARAAQRAVARLRAASRDQP